MVFGTLPQLSTSVRVGVRVNGRLGIPAGPAIYELMGADDLLGLRETTDDLTIPVGRQLSRWETARMAGTPPCRGRASHSRRRSARGAPGSSEAGPGYIRRAARRHRAW